MLQEHLHPVNLEDAHVAELPDFIRIQQLHSSGAFVEIVAEGDAAAPVLDLARACPEGKVERLGGLEEFAEGGDVDGLHGEH